MLESDTEKRKFDKPLFLLLAMLGTAQKHLQVTNSTCAFPLQSRVAPEDLDSVAYNRFAKYAFNIYEASLLPTQQV